MPIDTKRICLDLQQTYDAIQDGEYDEALSDIRLLCDRLGHPIHDEHEEEEKEE